MRRVTISCTFCSGEGRLEEFDCPCCLGEGYVEKVVCEPRLRLERPEHERVFNATPDYALSKKRRLRARGGGNQVVLGLLGLTDFKPSSDER